MKFALAFAALALLACTTPQNAGTIAGLETALTAVDQLALAYTSLPACNGTVPVCADPTIKAGIKTAAAAAYARVKAAEAAAASGGMPDTNSAEAAITALQNLVPKPAAP